MSGIINLVVGFLALFPGMFEAGVSNAASEQDKFFALLGTKYGVYAIALFLGAGIQMASGSWINLLLRSKATAIATLVVLVVVSIGLEFWGYFFRGYLTIFAAPGIVAGLLGTHLLLRSVTNDAQGL